MFSITRIAKLFVLAVLVAAAASFVGSARAATIDTDTVPTLGGDSFKFTGGTLYWHFSDEKFSIHLLGKITIKNANGSCARMRFEYFHGSTSINKEYGGQVCATDSGSQSWNVDFDSKYKNSDITVVKVSLENETAQTAPNFDIIGSANYSPGTEPDKIKQNGDGVSFGGFTYDTVSHTAWDSADLYWNRGDGADYTVRLIGTMYLHDVAGLCARINIRYYTESGTFITEKPSGSFCATDNSLQHYTYDISPYTSPDAERVDVQVQTQGVGKTDWNLLSSQTALINQ